jgi:hypothetical protein
LKIRAETDAEFFEVVLALKQQEADIEVVNLERLYAAVADDTPEETLSLVRSLGGKIVQDEQFDLEDS